MTYEQLRERCTNHWLDATRPDWRRQSPRAIAAMRAAAWALCKPHVDAMIESAQKTAQTQRISAGKSLSPQGENGDD